MEELVTAIYKSLQVEVVVDVAGRGCRWMFWPFAVCQNLQVEESAG